MWMATRSMTNTSKPSSHHFFWMERIAGRFLPVCILFVFAASLSSCDFLRKMAGRPTSAELVLLEQKRDSMEIERRLKHKRRSAEVQPAQTDSVASPTATVAIAETQVAPVATTAPAVPSTVKPANANADAEQIQALKDASGSLLLRKLSRSKGSAQASELFYVIAGTFKDAENAARFCRRLQADFPQALLLTLGNGYTLTSVYATGRADEVLAFLSEHKGTLPPEAWVLINDLR